MSLNILIVVALSMAVSGCVKQVSDVSQKQSSVSNRNVIVPIANNGEQQEEQKIAVKRVDFSEFSTIYRFSAEIPITWEVEYVPDIQSLNIYDPEDTAETIRDKSQIFIRFFEASQFLTLPTVTIYEQQDGAFNGHQTVSYDIEKKAGVADFPQQPSWRNERHQLTDIRYAQISPTFFYVNAYNPDLPRQRFDVFVDSLIFHNDRASLVTPLDRPTQRITKKPFGIKVSSDHSPVEPERFKGYHTAVDLEVFPNELSTDVSVKAFCGGKLLQRKTSSGYGGVLVQSCILEDEPVTVVYGHMRIDSDNARVGKYVTPGTILGFLGDDKSTETDGERKHLHFGIYKGSGINIKGYVQSEAELENWIDPILYIIEN